MKRSEKQIEASRLNGAKSRGPITPEGKLRSCQNAIRHVALARSITLEMEDSSIFLTNLNDLCSAWQPADLTEHKLVESMAVAMWKKDRYELSEKVASDQRIESDGHNAAPHTHPDAAVIAHVVIQMTDRERTLKSLNQTIALLDRQYSRALNMLMKVREHRRRLNPGQANLNPHVPAEVPEVQQGVQPVAPIPASQAPETDTPDAPAAQTLTILNTQKGTHKVFPINAHPQPQPAEPEVKAAEIVTGDRALGGAAA